MGREREGFKTGRKITNSGETRDIYRDGARRAGGGVVGVRVGKVRKEQQGNRRGKKWREEAKTRDEQRGDERAMGGKTKRRGETNIERNIGHGEGRESPMGWRPVASSSWPGA